MSSLAFSRKNNHKGLSHLDLPTQLDPMTFILFGASGDLAKRKIFPALYNLFINEKFPKTFRVIGLGRSEMSTSTFQKHVIESIKKFSRESRNDNVDIKDFLQAFSYISFDAKKSSDYISLLDTVKDLEARLGIPENRMFYLSVAPELINDISSNIKNSGLGHTKGWKRLIIEKPFGYTLDSARQLNEQLTKSFLEHEIFRIDHYLGKPMVQNLEALKFANPIIRALWNNQHVANIQITASETVGVEERAGYYDQAGAVRDMLQNHLLQLLMMTTMNLPENSTPEVIKFEKIRIMESLRLLEKEEVKSHVIRGQYLSGEIAGERVIGYRDEPGVETLSHNDTFIAARIWIDNEVWKGVPFYIRTGKRMKEKCTKIVIEFKNNGSLQLPNCMVISINPTESISLKLNMKNPFNGVIEPVKVNYYNNQQTVPEAYELLLFDALKGDSTFFAHWREVELSWQWVQTVLEAFEENKAPLYFYQSGTVGPIESNYLVEDDGFKWW
ncbi:glucose-6-phosphate dehydrogenase [Metabacillus sp. YM-086]|uniref:glucose-6-phosphate dehydrogenase n=1 Tax=Metabacillus sp. YM-086 TaxID=3341729 RepID=UPI001B947E9A